MLQAGLRPMKGATGAARAERVRAAAEAVWRFVVQRHCCGLNDGAEAVALYQISPKATAKVGKPEGLTGKS